MHKAIVQRKNKIVMAGSVYLGSEETDMAGNAKLHLLCFPTPHAQDGHIISSNVSSLAACRLKRYVTEESSYIHK